MRPPRLQFEGAFYHAYSRGNRREPVFIDDRDYFQFERYLMEAIEQFHVLVFAWCLMPNHFHLLLQTQDANIAQFMRALLARYAKYFNWRHGLSGHVFERRYNAILCDKEVYFLELLRYIHLNPYRVEGLPLAEPGKWKWSSHRYYEGLQAPAAVKRAIAEGLEHFADSPEQARIRYAAFLADGLERGRWEDFYKPRAGLYLGSESFIEAAKRKTRQPIRATERKLRRLIGIAELADQVQRLFGIDEESLRSRRQEGRIAKIRNSFIWVAAKRYHISGAEIGRYLRRGRAAVSVTITRFEKDPGRLATLRRLLKALEV